MTFRNHKFTTVINTAATVSSAFSVAAIIEFGIFAPTITSAQHLSVAENLALYNALNSYMTAVGAA